MAKTVTVPFTCAKCLYTGDLSFCVKSGHGGIGRAIMWQKCPSCAARYRDTGSSSHCPEGHAYRTVKSGKCTGSKYCGECANANRRRKRRDAGYQPQNYLIECDGESHCLAEWARIKSINRETLSSRLRRGLSISDALFSPSRRELGQIRAEYKKVKRSSGPHTTNARDPLAHKPKRTLSQDRTWYIYTLIAPDNREIRYVGWTTSPAKRLRGHISAVDQGREPGYKTNWVKSLLDRGLTPIMEIVESGVGESWKDSERKWISHYRSIGTRLTNLSDGGEGAPGVVKSAETREKLRLAMKNRIFSEEHKAKISRAKAGITSEAIRIAAAIARASRAARTKS